jgi:methionyl-tRNA formyltransferase
MKKIVFYGRRNTGVLALTFLKGKGYNVVVTDSSDTDVIYTAQSLGVKIVSMNLELTIGAFDLFLCVHGTKILPPEYLKEGKMVNIHPCLSYGLKGHNPIKRYIEQKRTQASVDSHFMTEEVDEGPIIHQQYFDTPVCNSYADFYNEAYTNYLICIDKTLKKLGI